MPPLLDGAPPPVRRRGSALLTEAKSEVRDWWYRPNTMKLDSSDGFYGRRARLMTYNPARMWHVLSPLMVNDLSGFSSFLTLMQSLFLVGLTLLVGLITPKDVADKVQQERTEAVNIAANSLRTLAAFVLGGFVSLVVGTWKERRRTYASLIGASRNLLIQLSTTVSVGGKQVARVVGGA